MIKTVQTKYSNVIGKELYINYHSTIRFKSLEQSQLIMGQLLRRNERLVKGGIDRETDGDGYCD